MEVCPYVHLLTALHSHALVYAAGEGLEYAGEPLIREESVEADVSGDGRADVAGNAGQEEEEKEKNPSTEQQTQESEVCSLRRFLHY